MQADRISTMFCHREDQADDAFCWGAEEGERVPSLRAGGSEAETRVSTPDVLASIASSLSLVWRETARIEALEKEVMLLKERVGELQANAPVTLTVDDLAPEPLAVVLPFSVVVSCHGEEFVARWFDANISASGATAAEALLYLKDMVVALFEVLSKHDACKLASGPARQLHVLNRHVRRKP